MKNLLKSISVLLLVCMMSVTFAVGAIDDELANNYVFKRMDDVKTHNGTWWDTCSVSENEWTTVETWEELERALSATGSMCIRMQKDITLKYEVGSKFACSGYHIRGQKVLDLNDHRLLLDDCSNAAHHNNVDSNGLHSVYQNSEGTFLIIDQGAILTLTDNGRKGEIKTDSYYIGNYRAAIDSRYNDFYRFRVRRDAIVVNGTLIVESGKIQAGDTKKQYMSKATDYEDSSITRDSFAGFAYQVTTGTAVTVNEGGVLYSYGGEFNGHGQYHAGISARKGSKVVFYDGLIYGSSSANCMNVSDGADVIVYCGEFRTGYHEYYRAVDYLDGVDTNEWQDAFASLGTGFTEGFNQHKFVVEKIDYGHIGIPKDCIYIDPVEGYGVSIRQNAQTEADAYNPNEKYDLVLAPKPKGAGGFELLTEQYAEEGYRSFETNYAMGQNLKLFLAKERTYLFEKEVVMYEPYFPADKLVYYSKDSKSRYLWLVKPDDKSASYEIVLRTDSPEADLLEIAKYAGFTAGNSYLIKCIEAVEWVGFHYAEYTNSCDSIRVYVNGECSHEWVREGTTATCTEPGILKSRCSICNATKEEDWEARGHLYVSDSGIVKDGQYLRIDNEKHGEVCVRCHEIGREEAHQFKKIREESFCEEHVEFYQCETCKAELQKAVPLPNGGKHEYEKKYYISKDSHWRFCKLCGYRDVSEHHFTGSGNNTETCKECEMSHGGAIDKGNYVYVSESNAACAHIELHMLGHFDDSEWNDKFKNETYASITWEGKKNGVYQVIGTGKRYKPSAATLNSLDDGDILMHIEFTEDGSEPVVGTVRYYKPSISVKEKGATCKEAGMKAHYVCNACGITCDKAGNAVSEASLVIPPKHVYSDSCDNTCNVCGEKKAAEETHIAGAEWVRKDGKHWHVCISCGEVMELGECSASDWITVTEATCEQEGFYVKECVTCKDKLGEKTVQKTHQFHEEVTENSTNDNVTEKRFVCDICKETHIENVEPTKHIYVFEEGDPANCMEEGRKDSYRCIICDAISLDENGKTLVSMTDLILPKDPNNHYCTLITDVEDELSYLGNEKEHWLLCPCGREVNRGSHEFSADGTICKVCDYSTKVDDHGEAAFLKKENAKKKHHTILFICIGIGVILVASVVTVLVLKKRSNKPNETIEEKPAEESPTTESPSEEAKVSDHSTEEHIE